MGFLEKIFNKENKEKAKEVEVFTAPEIDCKWECSGCHEGIDPRLHKYTKQNGNYFHRVCWKKALNMAYSKNLI